jgi:hypothetical protein
MVDKSTGYSPEHLNPVNIAFRNTDINPYKPGDRLIKIHEVF